MAIDNFEVRIAAAKNKTNPAAGIIVESGREQARSTVGTRNPDGTVNANIPSALSREDEIKARNAKTFHGPRATELRMPDTSMDPQPGSAVLLGDLLIWPAHDGGYFSKTNIYGQRSDGAVIKEPTAVLIAIHTELLKGNQPTQTK